MGWWQRWRQRRANAGGAHVLVVEFDYVGLDPMPLFTLEDEIERRLRRTGAGVYDGNQMAPDGSSGRLQVRGADAEVLLHELREVLAKTDFLRGARARLRFGPDVPGVHERELVLRDQDEDRPAAQ